MKLSALLLSTLVSVSAFAAEYNLASSLRDADVLQTVEFNGKAGVKAEAVIAQFDVNDDAILMINETVEGSDSQTVVTNDKLVLQVNNINENPILGVAKNGSLQITQNENGIGRDRWNRVLTVAYRNGEYVVAGLTYSYYDSLQEFAPENCDINFLTGKGVKDGKNVRVKTKAIKLADFGKNGEDAITCGW